MPGIMPVDYEQTAKELEVELAACEVELQADPPGTLALQARVASLKRSISWYKRRIPGRRITALGVGVADEITTAEAGP